jgi:N-acyl-D-glutamate deacylase
MAALALASGLTFSSNSATARTKLAPLYDLVIANGRVIDPETHLDALRNLGIRAGTIESLSTTPLRGKRQIDAAGLIVAPGFIDIHSHALNIPSNWMQAFDGVTTALELEIGALPISDTYAEMKQEGRPINYGFSSSWTAARQSVLGGAKWRRSAGQSQQVIDALGAKEWQRLATGDESRAIEALVEKGIKQGALGIGFLLGLAPTSNRSEFYELSRRAAAYKVPTFTHVRFSNAKEPGAAIEGFEEVIAVAAATGASMHICHVNSTALHDLPRILTMLSQAQAAGLHISTEAYPWGAGQTVINAAFLRPENLELLNIQTTDILYVKTGEHPASLARLAELQAKDPDGIAEIEYFHEKQPADAKLLQSAILFPGATVVTDALAYSVDGKPLLTPVWPLPNGAMTHPRAAATYAKLLARYVRDDHLLTLNEAFERASLWPARLLESVAPAMRNKGRIRVGADADLIVFDSKAIEGRATYDDPRIPSSGMRYVMVNGQLIIDNGILVQSARPGKPIRGPTREAP